MVVSVGDVGPGLSVVCQVRRTTTYVLTGGWIDLTFDTVDHETDSAQIEHDFGGGTERIYVKAAGTYEVSIQGVIDIAGTPLAGIGFYIAVNGNQLTGSVSYENIQGSTSDRRGFSRSHEVTLAAGDYVTWRMTQSGASATVRVDAVFTVRRYTGASGADGADGDITWHGDWVSQNYVINQAVAYLGSSYVCKVNTVASEIPTDTIYWDVLSLKGDKGDAGSANVPLAQARQSATISPAVLWADVTFDNTDTETSPTEIKHSATFADRIYVYTTGVYDVAINGTAVIAAAGDEAYTRLRVNDITLVAGSLVENKNTDASTSDLRIGFGRSVLVQLTAGDYVTLQAQRVGTGSFLADLTLSVRRYVGIIGPTGLIGPVGPAGADGADGSGVPTATNFTYNAETIVANKTLIDADATVQTLTCSVPGLLVILPPITGNTPFFLLVNSRLSASSFDVADSNGVVRVTCEPGQQVQMKTDAIVSFLTVFDNVPSTVGFIRFPFGGYVHTTHTGRFVKVNYVNYSATSLVTSDYTTELVAPISGTINYVTWGSQYSNVSATLKILVNGVPGAAIAISGAYRGATAVSVVIAAGDVIALQLDTAVVGPNYSVYSLYMKPAAGAGYVSKEFGAQLAATNYFYAAGGTHNSGHLSYETEQSRLTLGGVRSLEAVSWRTQSGMTTQQLSNYKNGILSETKIVGTGTSGVITGWATTYVSGDDCSFKNAVLASGATAMLAAFSGSGHTSLENYGRASANSGSQYNNYGNKTSAGTSSPAANLQYQYGHVIPATGVIAGLALSCNIISGSKPMNITVVGSGGSQTVTVPIVDYRGYAALPTPLRVAAGDIVFLNSGDTTDLSSGTWALMYAITD